MKCKDCQKMVCRAFYAKDEKWVGYCRVKETFTNGDWDCWLTYKTESGADILPTPFE